MILASPFAGDILGLVLLIVMFGGLDWFFDLTGALSERIRKGGSPVSRKESKRMQTRIAELERIVLRVYLMEREGLIQLPSEVAEEIDRLNALREEK